MPEDAANNSVSLDVSDDLPVLGTSENDAVELQSELGRGGMGIVYKGYQRHFERTVAIKMLHKHCYGTTQTLQRFMREARNSAQLVHQNLVRTYSLEMSADQSPFFIMEYVEGRTLAEIWAAEKPGTEQFTDHFSQILDGMQYAHEKGLVHRDLKPANVMVTESGVIKIMDFGIAKLTEADGSSAQNVTATGELLGSPFYMSPEQCRGYQSDARGDIYALGCMMFESLEGHPPFRSDAQFEVMLMHLNDTPPPVINASHALEKLIHKALSKDPAARPESCAEMKQAMLAAVREPVAKRKAAANFRKLTRRQKVKAGVVTCVVTCIASASLFITRTNQEREVQLLGQQPLKTLRDVVPRKGIAEFDPSSANSLILKADELRILAQSKKLSADQKTKLFKEAESCIKRAILLSEKDPDNASILVASHAGYAALLYERGDYSGALKEYNTEIALMDKIGGENNPVLARAYTEALFGVAVCYQVRESFEPAEHALLKAMRLREATVRESGESPESQVFLIHPMQLLGWLYYDWEKYDKALDYQQRCIAIFRAIGEEWVTEGGLTAHRTHAEYLVGANRAKEGLEEVRQAATLLRKLMTGDKTQGKTALFADMMKTMSQAYAALGDAQKARYYETASQEISDALVNGRVPDLSSVPL